MQLSEVLCCIFFMITAAASCMEITVTQRNEVTEAETGKKVTKRATMQVEDFTSHDHVEFITPNVNNYRRRMHSKKIVPIKAQFPNSKLKHKTSNFKPKLSRKPHKKRRYQNQIASKFVPPTQKNKKRNSKPRHRSPLKLIPKPRYEVPKFAAPAFDSSSHGEPPQNYVNYRPKKTSYGEPPVNSYGEPPVISYGEPPVISYGEPPVISYGEPPVISYGESPVNSYGESPVNSYGESPVDSYGEPLRHPKQDFPPWADDLDINFAFSNRQLSYVNPNVDAMFELHRLYKPKYFSDKSKLVGRPWRMRQKFNDNFIVGGQYAEPPPRFAPMPKLQNKEPLQGFPKLGSISNSYVNYKNSNLAFSPQNLNDVFSIVDK